MRFSQIITEVGRLQAAAIRVAGRCAVLPLTWLLRRSDRHRLWRLNELLFGADRIGVYPETSISAFATPSLRVQLAHLPAQGYNVSDHELLTLALLAACTRARCVFEFGTADGRTTLNLALNGHPGGMVYTINLPLDEDPGHRQSAPVGAAFQDTEVSHRVVQLWGDSASFDYAPYAGRCQLVFIDADHSEAGVTADTRTALKLVDRDGGVIVWHDALRYGVQTALPKLAGEIGPIHLVSRTNLAILCFNSGIAVPPDSWAPHALSAVMQCAAKDPLRVSQDGTVLTGVERPAGVGCPVGGPSCSAIRAV